MSKHRQENNLIKNTPQPQQTSKKGILRRNGFVNYSGPRIEEPIKLPSIYERNARFQASGFEEDFASHQGSEPQLNPTVRRM